MAEADPMPLGFDREAARIGVCLNGFYLFVAFSPIPRLKSNGIARYCGPFKAWAKPARMADKPLENWKNAS
jgi:hypothetical protein